MDLSQYKGKTLDDDTISAIAADIEKHTETLNTRALKAEDKARKAANESIEGRKGKDALIQKAFEKLGIENPEDLDSLPDLKGQADAARQLEVALKRAQREAAEAAKARDEITAKYTGERKERAIAEAVGRQPFIDLEDARALVSARLQQEGDDLLFKGPDGALVPLADGVAWLAKTKPHLVKPSGEQTGGSGFKGSSSKPAPKSMKRSEFDGLSGQERSKAMRDGYTLTDD
jgi:hypothetical protein